ncbi:MAG: trypsin-like peptidase domain-containing protein [Methyloligella sp. ZOD6]
MPAIPKNIIESVFYLYSTANDASEGLNPVGTGFVVEVQNEFGLPRHHYAVTNWHVACQCGSVIRLPSGTGDPSVIDLGPDQWEFIPGKYDIAVTPLNLTEQQEQAISSVSTGAFVRSPETNPFVVGDDVFMLGLFVDHAGVSKNVPSARFGNISMLPDRAAPVKQPTGFKGESYVVDMHSRTGYSGSPVFAYRTFAGDLRGRSWGYPFDIIIFNREHVGEPEKTLQEGGRICVTPPFNLLGIHWGQFPEQWKVERGNAKSNRVPVADYVQGMSGMSVVIPSWCILEVLDLPKLKNQRAAADAAINDR